MSIIKILFLTGDLNYTDGVSSHLFNLLSELGSDDELELHMIYSGGQAFDKFKDTNVKISLNKNLNHDSRSLINFSKAFFDIRKYLKTHGINIIHSHNHYAANLAGRAARYLKVRTVQTIHGIIPEAGRLKHFYADKFILLNENNTEYLKSKIISQEKNIYRIRQGIRENSFKERELFQSEEAGKIPVILFASRLVEGKGADLFIKASAEVRKKYSDDIKFIIAGEGVMEKELKELSGELNSEIEFAGNVSDIFQLMKRSDIFVNASSISGEGFPMIIAEAAFSGCLLISAKADWLEEVFSDGEDGYCFEKNNYLDLADKILAGLHNKDLSQKFAKSFQNKSKVLFDIKKFAVYHKNIYKECLRTN